MAKSKKKSGAHRGKRAARFQCTCVRDGVIFMASRRDAMYCSAACRKYGSRWLKAWVPIAQRSARETTEQRMLAKMGRAAPN